MNRLAFVSYPLISDGCKCHPDTQAGLCQGSLLRTARSWGWILVPGIPGPSWHSITTQESDLVTERLGRLYFPSKEKEKSQQWKLDPSNRQLNPNKQWVLVRFLMLKRSLLIIARSPNCHVHLHESHFQHMDLNNWGKSGISLDATMN